MYIYMMIFSPLIILSVPIVIQFYNKMSIMLKMDLMVLMFLVVLIFVFEKIMIFSIIYMYKSINNIYFNYLMMSFLVSMLLLLINNSLLIMLISWEMLGLTSYLLVLYYYNWNSLQGSLLTFLTNRIGDSFLMMSLLMMNLTPSVITITIIFIMGITKSAQFPFSSWLPAAMAAPTPVSALVHSSTLVTAGLFLCFKYLMPMHNMLMKELFMFMGIMTMISGSVMALLTMDIKKIVAFSTLSQLGFLMIIFYSLYYGLFLFHLLVHALLKSFLFMMMGLIMMKLFSQNYTMMMSSINQYNSYSMFLVIFLNFCSFMFSSMFLSKEISIINLNLMLMMLKIFLMMSLMLTLFYMKRLLMLFIYSNNMFSLLNYKFEKVFNLKYLYLNLFCFYGLLWYMNMIKSELMSITWKLIYLLFIVFLFMKMSLMNLFKLMLYMNMLMNLLNYYFISFFKEDSFMLSLKYNFFILLKTMLIKFNFMIFMLLMFVFLN